MNGNTEATEGEPRTVSGSPSGPDELDRPQFSIFTIPKAFDGHIGLIQRNAIASWRELRFAEILLLGDESGVAEAAEEFGVRHLPAIERNERGTPLLSDAFRQADSVATSPVMVYCNADIIMFDDMTDAIRRMVAGDMEAFLGIGRRRDLDVTERIDFSNREQLQTLRRRCQVDGKDAAAVCKDYFVFPKGQLTDIPPFVVGRGNWDNWMVHHARKTKIPVIDFSPVVTVVHQNHDYRHVAGGRMKTYVSGEEAKQNRRLAGGSHLILGSATNFTLRRDGIHKVWMSWANLRFWTDLPSFVRLVRNMLARQD